MEIKHDEEADAIYISFNSKPYAYGKDLDDERRVDYASDKTPIGVELLNVSKGVNLYRIPHIDEVAEVLETAGIRIYEMIPYPTSENASVFDVRLNSPAEREQESYVGGFKQEVTA